MASQVRQNFHEDNEAGINRQINMELCASYVYQSMAFHFDRDDVALPGFHKFFKKQSNDEMRRAEVLMKYQNSRGGRIVLQNVRKPEKEEWGTGLEAMQTSLQLEKSVNQSLLDLHKLARINGDVHMTDFLEDTFLNEQVKSLEEISKYIKNLIRNGPNLGEYQFDRETFEHL